VSDRVTLIFMVLLICVVMIFQVNPLVKAQKVKLLVGLLNLSNFEVANSITFKDYESIRGAIGMFWMRRYFATICDLAGNLELSGIYLS